jgi:hypothetical protein
MVSGMINETNGANKETMLALIKATWEDHPSWSFCQLVANVSSLDLGRKYEKSLYEISDTSLLEKLEKFPYVY